MVLGRRRSWIAFNNIVPVTNSAGYNCSIHSGGSFQATTYLNVAAGSTTFIDVTTAGGDSHIAAGLGVTGTMYLRNVNSTSVDKFMDGRTYSTVAGPSIAGHDPSAFWNGGQGMVDGIRC